MECCFLPLAVCVLFLSLPYSISLVVQWLYGWPNKPGCQKYIEALKPSRIYGLTVAVLDILKNLKYGKLYFQWNMWYSNEKNSTYFAKGIAFGRRGHKLDLYYSPSHSKVSKIPVVVFVYGGAWGSGDRSMYCLLAKQMAKELNVTVLCPDYSIYPKGNVLNMIQDISDSIMWVKEQGSLFNLDQENIVLIGHSAGAHLCALTALFLVNNTPKLFIETLKQKELVTAIKGIIGLSGVYSIMDHYEHEQTRAVEYVSTMHKAMGGLENFHYYSPTSVLKKLQEDQLKRVPPVVLLHGDSDIIVPVKSSVRFSALLSSLSIRASLHIIPQMNHIDIVTDLMASERHFYRTVFDHIKQEYSKFQGPVD